MIDYTIALSGLSDTDAAMFEAALGSLPTHPWKLVDTPPAGLLVIDVDTVWGHMDWLRAVGSGQTVVAYSNDGNVNRDELALDKPLRTRDLADLLEQVAAPGATAPAIATPATDTASAKPVPEPEPVPESAAPAPADDALAQHEFIAPEVPPADAAAEPTSDTPSPDTALGICLMRGQIEHALELEHDGVRLRLDPERAGYTGSSTLKPLASLLDQPLKATRPLSDAQLTHMRDDAAIPLTRLLWFAALRATPGVLSPDLAPDAVYRLTRWPQIEREFPRHFRIATAMMKSPGTPGDIASVANAPIADVVDFINAYSIAGFVSHSQVDTEPVEPENKRMFSRLRRSLSRNGA